MLALLPSIIAQHEVFVKSPFGFWVGASFLENALSVVIYEMFSRSIPKILTPTLWFS